MILFNTPGEKAGSSRSTCRTMRIVTKVFDCILTSFLLGGLLCSKAQVNITAPPENITVCKNSDVIINCRYQSASTFPTAWLINGTVFTQQNLRDSPLYQLNNPFIPRSYSLTVFSITATTTFQCIVQSNPSSTSTLGTVTVIDKPIIEITATGGYRHVYVSWSVSGNISDDACRINGTAVAISFMGTSMTVNSVPVGSHNFTGLPDNTTINITIAGHNMMSNSISFNFTSARTTAVDNAGDINDDSNDHNNSTDDDADNNGSDSDNDGDEGDNDGNNGDNDGNGDDNDGNNDGEASDNDGGDNNNNNNRDGGDNDGNDGDNMANIDSHNNDGSGSSVAVIAGGAIGGIVVVIIIIIILIGLYFFYRKKKGSTHDDRMNLKSPTTTDKSHASGGEGITNTQDENVVYASPAQTAVIPHQASASGEQYAVSTKATNKTNKNQPTNNQYDDVRDTKMDTQGVTYADLQELPTDTKDTSFTFADAAVTYSQIT